jgi:hypothetical protein
MILIDIILFILIAWSCWQGYSKRQMWLSVIAHLLARLYRGKGYWHQLFTLGPIIVVWLLLCHWLANHGARGLGAGGLLLAMTLGLDGMRHFEEKQKLERKP